MTPALIAWSLVVVVLIAGWLTLLRLLDRAHGADWGNRWLNRIDGLCRIYARRYHRLIARTDGSA